ncbi:MAG: hypothetical protein ACT4QD_13725 [Acidobacteriota bacterium]
MRRFFCTVTLVFVLAGSFATSAQAPPKQASGEPKVTWYFYTVKWGFQDEFLDLFQRNHYPVLKARERAGQFASVKTFVPEFHGDGRADWTFAVELVVPANAPATPTTEEIVANLYKDRATFNREEQRRFELLLAHWDVPLNRMDLGSRRLTR